MNTGRLTWSAGAVSEQGRREENQDRMTRFTSPFGEVVAVADGMGGMQGGATAAAAVTSLLPTLLSQTPPATPPAEALRAAIRAINAEIFRQGHSGDPAIANMGTTIVLALLRDTGEALVANIGDSRAYLFRDGVLRQLTRDHSAVQRLVDAGALSPEEARRHPEASVLSRAIGQQPDVELELYPPFQMQPGDGILLCSDGLSGFTASANIQAVLAQDAGAAGAVEQLEQLALSAGSDDNITIQYLRVHSPPRTARKPRRRWPLWAAAALAVCLGAILFRPKPAPLIPAQKATGASEQVPVAPPPQPDTSQPAKPVVLVYAPGVKPHWPKLDCAEFRYRDPAELAGAGLIPDPVRPRIFYRRKALAAKDCLHKSIPALATAKMTEMNNLPNNADIVVVLPVPQETKV